MTHRRQNAAELFLRVLNMAMAFSLVGFWLFPMVIGTIAPFSVPSAWHVAGFFGSIVMGSGVATWLGGRFGRTTHILVAVPLAISLGAISYPANGLKFLSSLAAVSLVITVMFSLGRADR